MTANASPALRHAGQTVIRDGAVAFFGSLTITRFAWNGIGDDGSVIAALPNHCRCAGECSAEKWWCRLGPIVPAAYERVGADEAVAVVETFCEGCAAIGRSCPATILDEAAASVIGPLRASACYRLRDLPDALREMPYVDAFGELVAIDRRDGVVLLVMMAMD